MFVICRVFDTFWEYKQQVDDDVWARIHLLGKNYQEEDCVPGLGATAAITNIVNATEQNRFVTGGILNLVGVEYINMTSHDKFRTFVDYIRTI